MTMREEAMNRFVKAARHLCKLRCVDPDARVYSRDGYAMPEGPTNEKLAALDLFKAAQVHCSLQKYGLNEFEFVDA